jgi:hypothetical protein
LRTTPHNPPLRQELQAIRGKWIALVALGFALIVLGFQVVAALATVTLVRALILNRWRRGDRRRVLVSRLK